MKHFYSRGFPFHRGRRLRNNKNICDLVTETNLSVKDLVMPYFLREDNDETKISNMPGLKRFSVDELIIELEEIENLGIKTVAIFPKINEKKKDDQASESLNEDNLVCRSLRQIQKKCPNISVVCDLALDAYTTKGHDGVVDKSGSINNDQTIEILSNMAVLFATNGCKIVAPSDMMDGRVKIIRETLEKENFKDTVILSYSSKFSSNFYSPFRDALGSKTNLGDSSKNTYQINFKNKREAIKESLEDQHEGADILMVKPAMYYLDIINELKNNTFCPIAAYQVSGEYSMIKYLSDKQIFNHRDVVLESLYCIKRAGADIIFTYFAKEVAKWLK